MKNKIRYSRLPKYAYGTKLPKYAYGYEDNNTYQQPEGVANAETTNAQGIALGDSIGSNFAWFAAANTAQKTARGMTAKKRIVNPKTGEVTEYASTDEGQVVEEIAQPYHEKYANDIKNGDYGGIAAQLVGGPVGQMAYNAIWGRKKKADFNRGKEAEANTAQSELDAEEAKRKQDFENKQRDIYSRAYIASNPEMGREGASIYAYGTSLNGMAIPKKAMGGNLNPIASNVDKAVGDTHEQGGITLTDTNGKPKAEIEGQEVVVNDKSVLSDRLPFTGGISFAKVGEELGKEKGKNEDKLKTGDMFERNGAKRTIANIDKKMETLLKYQDVVRTNLGLDNASPVNNAKYGGIIPKYWKGTREDEDEDNAIGTDEYGRQFINKYKSNTDTEPSYKFNPSRDVYANPDEDIEVPGATKYDTDFSSTLKGYKGETDMNGYKYDKNSDTFVKTNSNKRGGFDAKGYGQMAENAAPYLDNAINYALIKQTPKIPKPIKNVAIDEMAMPLNTNYNINPTLIANNQDLKEFNKNILDNTASSNNARASMASGFAKKLAMNNNAYAQKENVENQLKNQNALNLQSVNNRNVNNRQNIDNANIAQDNKYNWDNMLRDSDIQDRKSKLGAETTNDITTGIQDKRMAELDNKKIFYDSLKHDDASGFATLIGTDEMSTLMKDPKTKQAVYDSLKRGGQTKAYKKAKELYGE